MRRSIINGTIAVLVLFLVSCVSAPGIDEKPVLKPSFENALKGLDIAKAVNAYVRPGEKLAVVSIERMLTGDYPVNYIIEDNLIANLVGAHYVVVERDEDLLARILYEQGDRYQRVIPDSPAAILLGGVEAKGMAFLGQQPTGSAPISAKDTIEFFTKLGDFYRDMLSQVKVVNADVLISYRVLECGIMVEKEAPRRASTKDKAGASSADGSLLDPLKVNFKREAMARIAVRIVDAKTGEIRFAGILENRAKDTLAFEQEKGMTEIQFLGNVQQYQEYLENFHYTFYDQQLPNVKGTMKEQQEIISQTSQAQSVALPGQTK
jgi:hypothetical protein